MFPPGAPAALSLFVVAAPLSPSYRGRLAPSPTGWLHLGHARTFWTAQQRARAAGGILVLRNDDLDRDRCRAGFVDAMLEDLRWFGFAWDEGPDVGGPYAPYAQDARQDFYRQTFARLRTLGVIYPCTCSRQDVQAAAGAPHEGGDEPVYPGTCRPENLTPEERSRREELPRGGVNWRLRVPDGESLEFVDGHAGALSLPCGKPEPMTADSAPRPAAREAGGGVQRAVAGREFGDFLVWRKDDRPSYQLACVADDSAMRITEVVRGADLLLSTFRQILLYRHLGLALPAFFHCPLMTDEQGIRLAKRHDSLSLRTLRAAGRTPQELRANWK